MALTLRQMVQALDAEMDLAKEECTEFVAEHSSWLEEAVAANTKQLLYKSNREFECPRSHRKPTRSKRKVGLTAVSEEPEEKENTSHNPEDRSHAKRGLASRNNHTNMKAEEVGSKRKSNSSGDLEEDAKQPREETKRINRDQLAEINAAAAWASSPRVLQAVAQTAEGASVDYVQMKVPELRSKLEELGLSSQGRKDDLITRLKVADLNAKKMTITDLKAKKLKLAEVKAIVRETGLADDGKMSDLLDRLETHFSEGNNGAPGHENNCPHIAAHADNDVVEPPTTESADLVSNVQEQADELEEKEPTREATRGDPQVLVVETNAPAVEDDNDDLSEVNDIGVPPSEPAPVPVALQAPAVAEGYIESVEEQASPTHGSDDEEREGEEEAQKQIGHLDVEDQLDGSTMKSTDVDAIEVELVDASPTAGKGGLCGVDESIDAPIGMPYSGQMGPTSRGAEVELSARLQEEDTTCVATDDPEAADDGKDEPAHLSTTNFEQQSGASKLVKGLKRVGERPAGSSVSPGLSPRPNHLRPAMNVSGGYAMCDELQRKLQARQARLREQVSLSSVQESEDLDAVDGSKVEKHEREVPRSLPAPSQHEDKRRAKEAAEARQREAAEQRRREEKEAAEQRRAKETAVKEAAEQKKREEKEAAEQKIRAKELAAEQRAKEAAEQRRREKEAAEQKAKEAAELRAKKVRAEEQRLKEKLQLEEKRAEEKRALLDKRKEDKDEKKEIPTKKINRKSQAANAHGSQARGTAPSAQAAPALPEGWAEYFDKKTERTYFHNAISKTTTWSRPGVEPAAIGSSNGKKRVFSTESCASQQYPIDETKPESTSDEGSDSEDEEEQKKKVPRWVERSKLMPQIELQQNIDADEVFGQRIHEQEVVCDLEDIFGHSDPKKRYHRRTSSGCWDQDKLTSPEEHIYKTALGFFR